MLAHRCAAGNRLGDAAGDALLTGRMCQTGSCSAVVATDLVTLPTRGDFVGLFR